MPLLLHRRELLLDDDVLFSYLAGTDPTLSGGQFSRAAAGTAGNASYFDPLGVLRSTTGARYAHYIGGVPYLLLEGQSTNLSPRANPTIAQLSSKSVTVTDGTLNAYGFTNSVHFPAAAQLDYAYFDVGALTNGVTYAASAFIVMDDASAPVLGVDANTGDLALTLEGATALTGSPLVSRIGSTNLYRVSATRVANAGGNHYFGVRRAATVSGKGFHVVGYQLEALPFPTSLILSAGAATIRAADVLYWPFPWAPCELTGWADFIDLGTCQAGLGLWGIGAGSNESVFALGTAGLGYRTLHRVASDVTAQSAAAVGFGSRARLRSLLAANGAVQNGQAIDAGAEVMSAASAALPMGAAWSDTKLYVGARGPATTGFAAFRKLAFLRVSHSAAECEAA